MSHFDKKSYVYINIYATSDKYISYSAQSETMTKSQHINAVLLDINKMCDNFLQLYSW